MLWSREGASRWALDVQWLYEVRVAMRRADSQSRSAHSAPSARLSAVPPPPRPISPQSCVASGDHTQPQQKVTSSREPLI